MKFLTDQDVYALTVQFLRDSGHDVVTAAERGLSRAADANLLREARVESRLFVTRDRDFGGLVFVEGDGPGVIYLRVVPSTLMPVHAELERLLSSHSETVLSESFVVVEPGRHRIRRVITR